MRKPLNLTHLISLPNLNEKRDELLVGVVGVVWSVLELKHLPKALAVNVSGYLGKLAQPGALLGQAEK